jgi:predicted Zn-dependent peptidase
MAALLLAAAAPAGELAVRASGGEAGRMRRYFAHRDAAEAVLLLRFAGGYADEVTGSGIPLVGQHALLTAHRKVKLEAVVGAFHGGGTAELTTSLGPHESVFMLRAHRKELLDAAETLCTLVFSPAFDPGAFAGAVERSMVNGAPRLPFHDLVARLSMFTFVNDARYRPEVNPDQVEGVILATVKRHAAAVYTAGNATAIATGGFPVGGLDSLLDRFSGGERIVVRPPKLALPVSHRFRGRQERHEFFFPIEMGSPKAVAAARVAAALLQEQVEQRIRRLGHAVIPESRLISTETFRGLAVVVPDHPQLGSDLGALVRQEATVLREARSLPEDIAAARAEAARRLLEVDGRPARLAEELLAGLQAQAGGEWLGPGSVKDIQALTDQELVELVGPSLSPNRSVHLYYSPDISPIDATAMPEGDLR